MLYGVETCEPAAPVASVPPYAASGVQFNSAIVKKNSVACTDNQYFAFAGWFKTNWLAASQSWIMWAVDPLGNYNSYFQKQLFTNTAAYFNIGGSVGGFKWVDIADNGISGVPLSNTWMHFICAGQTNFAAGSKIIKMKINGVDSGGTSTIGDTFGSFNATTNGLPFWFGSDATSGPDFYVGAMADVSIWPGFNFLTAGDISAATIALFFKNGSPVNPSVAIAHFGAPPIFLTGNAANFASNNLGTSGAFTLSQGTLTNVSGPP